MKNKRKNKQKYTNKIAYSVIAILIVLILFITLGNATLSYNFGNTNTHKNWVAYNTNIELTQNSIRLNNIKKSAIFVNRQKNLQTLSWQNNPYVKIMVKPTNFDRKIALFWSPTKKLKNLHQRPVNIPANNDSIIVNVAQNIPWLRSFGWKNSNYGNTQISSFGLLIPQQYNGFEVDKITLLPSLNIFDYIKVISSDLAVVEPVKVSSINAQYGISVLGSQLAYFLGIVLILLAIPALIWFNKKSIGLLIIGVATTFILYDITTNLTLLDSAKYAYKHSAWSLDKHQEYRSRFGEAFAKLAQELEAKVPRGAKVSFPKTRDYRVIGESNWIAFQYYGLYKISDIWNADYIFYYYPKDLQFDPANNSVKDGKKQYKTTIIAKHNNNYILKKYEK